MPFYPALPPVPSYREMEHPVADLTAGVQAGQNIYGTALRNAAMAEEIRREQTRRTAMEAYQKTGDPAALYPALTPEQALVAPAQLQQQQMNLANAAVGYWDSTKAGITRETYPLWRQETMRRFPQVSQAMFPDPSTFKSDEDFNKWKYEREMMAARFKMMADPRLDVAKLNALSRERAAGMRADASRYSADVRADATKYAADTRTTGTGGRGTSGRAGIPSFVEYRNAHPDLSYDQALKNYNNLATAFELAKEKGKQQARSDAPPKKLTPLQEEKLKQEKAKGKLKEELLKPAPEEEGMWNWLYKGITGEPAPAPKETGERKSGVTMKKELSEMSVEELKAALGEE